MRKSINIFAVLLVGLLGTKLVQAETCNGVSSAANLVSNCSFGTGTFADFTGTTVTDPYGYNNGVGPAGYASGIDQGDPLALAGSTMPYGGEANEAYLASDGYTDTLTQSLTTVAGQYYQVEFALLNDTAPDAPSYPNSFLATFGGTTLLSQTNTPVDGYTLYTYDLFAASDSTDLSFTTENSQGDFELDSISVEAVPTPEPSSIVLLGTGILGLAGVARRRMMA